MASTKQPSDFRVLLVYPNLPLMLVPPLSIALFTSLLKEQGYSVELFDCTPYLDKELDDRAVSPENRVTNSQAREFDYTNDLGVVPNTGDIRQDFLDKVETFNPDILVYSVVEDAFRQCLTLLETVEHLEIPSILGGVFPTAAPELCMKFKPVQTIGVGEGERIIADFAEAVRNNRDYRKVAGTWSKDETGRIIKNERGGLVNINDVYPDYSLFDPRRFYRPMGGRIFKTFPVETYRGCPYTCTFCNSPMHNTQSKEEGLGKFLRRKPMDRLREELAKIRDEYDPEFIYFIDDSFLARPKSEIYEFCEMYKEFKIPFWFNTRPENCTEEVLEKIVDVGAYRVSFGIECGNEVYRKKVLLRYVTNERLFQHFDLIAKSNLKYSANLIVGFPGETRELVMDTVNFVREISGYDTLTVSIFTPYNGTSLRDVAVKNNWLDPDTITVHTTASSLLRMPAPYLSAEEIDGLVRTIPLYCYFPKSEWDRLRRAEVDDEEGRTILDHYMQIYRRDFLGMDQDESKVFVPSGSGCRANEKDRLFLTQDRLSEGQYADLLFGPAP
jgi:anaerobic magnesium-protoporphyrin IX monomethyl ester cyclase